MFFLMAVELLNGAAGKLCQVGIGRHGKKAAAGGLGEVLQCFGVQFADNMFAFGVLPESVFSLRIRNGTAGFRADAYRNDQKSVFARFFGNFRGGIHGVFAITENDEGIGPLRRAAFEVLHGFAEHKAEIGAAGTGPPAVHLFQSIAQSGVVISERHHEVCFTGKDNEPYFIRRQRINQFIGGGAGFFQT